MKMKTQITGVADVAKIFREIAPREGINLARSTTQAIASDLAKSAKNNAPQDDGDLKASIKAKRERGTPQFVHSTVRVSKDAFYWRFLEYGQGPDGEEHAFFLRALQAFRPHMESKYTAIFVKKLQARLRRLKKANGV